MKLSIAKHDQLSSNVRTRSPSCKQVLIGGAVEIHINDPGADQPAGEIFTRNISDIVIDKLNKKRMTPSMAFLENILIDLGTRATCIV